MLVTTEIVASERTRSVSKHMSLHSARFNASIFRRNPRGTGWGFRKSRGVAHLLNLFLSGRLRRRRHAGPWLVIYRWENLGHRPRSTVEEMFSLHNRDDEVWESRLTSCVTEMKCFERANLSLANLESFRVTTETAETHARVGATSSVMVHTRSPRRFLALSADRYRQTSPFRSFLCFQKVLTREKGLSVTLHQSD